MWAPWALGLAAWAAHAALAAAGSQRKPNILFMVADDLGFADQGFMTNATVSLTPNLDALALQGTRLFNHHVQPFCSPTRATIMTGRHVLRYGLQNSVIWPQDPFAVPRNETFLSQNLKDAGYRTGQFGKWHLGMYREWALPMARGFDEQYGYYLGALDYWSHERYGGVDWHRNQSRAELGERGRYTAGLLGEAVADFVTRWSSPETPWFVYLALQSVHSPLQAPEDCLARYSSLNGSQRLRAAMVAAMDDAVGNITKALKATHQMDSTVIVFTSDNGAPFAEAMWEGDDESEAMLEVPNPAPRRPPRGEGFPPHGAGGGSNYPLTGWKHYVFEGGVRSAAFVHYRGLPGPAEHWGLFHSTDWLPTLVRLAGGSTARNQPLDGFDIWGALEAGNSSLSPRAEVPVNIAACGADARSKSGVAGPQAAIIVGDLKLIVDCFWRSTRSLAGAQLYNITGDITESVDLAQERPGDVARLADRLAFWEGQSIAPYSECCIERACGTGGPRGKPPVWQPWCSDDSSGVAFV